MRPISVIISIFIVLISLNSAASANEIDSVYEWTDYQTYDGVRVEYKLEKCESGSKNEVWLVFRFTNTTTELKEINWVPVWYSGEDCVNCERLDDFEFNHALSLEPGESMSGEACVNQDQRFYIFSHFIVIHPGMPEDKLTSFELTRVKVK